MNLENLKSGDTSKYKILDYNYLKRDPLIYSSVKNVNMALYLDVPENFMNYTYNIDSSQIQYKRVYVSFKIRD